MEDFAGHNAGKSNRNKILTNVIRGVGVGYSKEGEHLSA